FAQAFDLARFGECRLGGADALQGSIFDEGEGGDGDQRLAVVGVMGGKAGGHDAAYAVAERDEVLNVQRVPHWRKELLGFVANEAIRPATRMRCGATKAEPVVGNDIVPGGYSKALGKVAPQLDA